MVSLDCDTGFADVVTLTPPTEPPKLDLEAYIANYKGIASPFSIETSEILNHIRRQDTL